MTHKVLLFLTLHISYCVVFGYNNEPTWIKDDKTNARCLGHVCLKAGYDKNVAPRSKGPLTVGMTYTIKGISHVDCDKSEIGLDISLRQTWVDDRVFVRNTSLWKNNIIGAPPSMYKSPNKLPKVWIPSLYLINMTDMTLRKHFEDHTTMWFTRRKNIMYVDYAAEFDLHVSCDMDLKKFPFDHHTCPVKIASRDLLSKEDLLFISYLSKNTEMHTKSRQFNAEILELNSNEDAMLWEGQNMSISGFEKLHTMMAVFLSFKHN